MRRRPKQATYAPTLPPEPEPGEKVNPVGKHLLVGRLHSEDVGMIVFPPPTLLLRFLMYGFFSQFRHLC